MVFTVDSCIFIFHFSMNFLRTKKNKFTIITAEIQKSRTGGKDQ
jgi:hypothetical protein